VKRQGTGFRADKVKVWFDAEADFLEVRFSDAAGYEKETNHDAVMERVDENGTVIGLKCTRRRLLNSSSRFTHHVSLITFHFSDSKIPLLPNCRFQLLQILLRWNIHASKSS
jgi:hypothetical protein